LVALGKEKDGDYHLVLQDLHSPQTMIAEIPDPQFVHVFPFLDSCFTAARMEIEEIIQAPGRIQALQSPLKIRVNGVIFFDKKHNCWRPRYERNRAASGNKYIIESF
jgi:hypothetical protein